MKFLESDLLKLMAVQEINQTVKISKKVHTLNPTGSMGILTELSDNIEEEFNVLDLPAFTKTLKFLGEEASVSLSKGSMTISLGNTSLSKTLASEGILKPFPSLSIFDEDVKYTLEFPKNEIEKLQKLNTMNGKGCDLIFINNKGLMLYSTKTKETIKNFIDNSGEELESIKIKLELFQKITLPRDTISDTISFHVHDRFVCIDCIDFRYLIAATI